MNSEREFVVAILAIIAFVASIITGGLWLSSISCQATSEAMGVKHRWTIMTDCMIEDGDKWVPLKNYRDIRN